MNSEYFELAYRRAILCRVVGLLKKDFTTALGNDEASEVIVCEDVIQSYAEVPEEEVVKFIAKLEVEESQLKEELSKFEFVRKAPKAEEAPHPGKKSSRRSRRA